MADTIRDLRDVPWAQVEAELLRDPRIIPQCKALYSLLITYGPRRIFPSQQTLGDCLGVSRQTVKAWLDELKALDLIAWTPRNGSSNEYDILGYANLRTEPVKPTLQGCKASLTPPVKPTLHDPDPVIQIQELEKTASADFWGPDGKPDREPITTNLPKSAHGPLDLTIKTQDAREKEKQWTVPDNGSLWAEPYGAFCRLFPMSEPGDQPDKKRDNWTSEIKRLALEVHATPQRSVEAIKAIARLEQWMIKPSTTPFKSSWAEAFQNTLIMNPQALQGLLDGQPISKGNGHAQLTESQQSGLQDVIARKNLESARKHGFAHLLEEPA